MEIKIDHEFKTLIPQPTPDELKGLEESLKREGCRDPLVVWQGKNILLDGHNRLAICEKHSIHYELRPVDLATREDAKIWIIRNQFARRNISQVQRLELALVLEPLIREKNKKRQAHGETAPGITLAHNCGQALERNRAGDTDRILGNESGTSHCSVYKYRKIKELAAGAIQAMVSSGDISINAGYNVSKLPKEEQEMIAAGGVAEVKRASSQNSPGKTRKPTNEPEPIKRTSRVTNHAINCATEAMEFAVMAISQLERIRKDDPRRIEALERVELWIGQRKKEK